MIDPIEASFFPWFINIFRTINVGFPGIIRCKADIKSIFVVTQTCRPHSFSVNALFSFELLRRRIIKSFKYMCSNLPMHQIIGF